MRIDRIRIENFRRFKEVDLELPDGVTALVGRNGAGKSTLLEAIGWALYGNEAARTGKDLIKRRGAAPGDDVRVHLAFRLGEHQYEVTRELLGKQEAHVATVKVDGKVAVPAGAASGKEATGYVARLFHMDRDAFFTSLVARQRELSALTDAKPADRKRILIGLLRLDAVDAAIGTARQRKRDARQELAGLKSAMLDVAPLLAQRDSVMRMLEATRAQLAQQESAIATLVDEVESLREKREASRGRHQQHQSLLFELQRAREKIAFVQREKERRGADLAQARAAGQQAALLAPRLEELPAARARCETLAALRVQAEELARVRAEMAQRRAELEVSQKAAATAQAALAGKGALDTLAKRVAAERTRLQAVLGEAQRKLNDLRVRELEAQRLLRETTEKEQKIRTLGPATPCPTCTRPLHEHHGELLHGFAQEIERWRGAQATLVPQLDAARQAEAEARRQIQALADRDEEIRVKSASLAREEERLLQSQARVADAQKRLAALAQHEAALGAQPYDAKADADARALVRQLEEVATRHARLVAEAEREPALIALVGESEQQEKEVLALVADAQVRITALAFDAAAHEASERAAGQAEARLADARVLRERLTGEIARRMDEEKRLAAEIERQEMLASKAAALDRRVALLEQLAGDRDVGLLPEFKDHLIGRVRPLLSAHAGRLFRELTEGRYADLEIAEDYGLRVHEDGQAFTLERFSGGEGDLANLCLRLAVSQLVAERAGTDGLGFLALDEVFGSQDEIRKQSILRALAGLSGRFRQILLITHINDVKDAAECVLRVETLGDGTSVVVVEGGA